MMRKVILLLFLLTFWGGIVAQNNGSDKKYALKTSATSFGFSSVRLMDNYLSPLPYSGIGLEINNKQWSLFSPENTNLSHLNRFDIAVAIASNPAQTATMMYFRFNYGWGMHYHFRPIENLQLLAGGVCDVDFGFKSITRNVNNPINIDFGMNINASGVAIYDFSTYRRTYRFQIAFEVPFMGFMFTPEQGSSYFDMLTLRSSGNYFHLTSFHNRVGFKRAYSVQIPFQSSTWHFGVEANSLKYTANDMFFRRNDYTFFMGVTKHFYNFSKKNPAPSNFIGF